MDERRETANEFESIPIITDNSGTRVLLGEIASVVDGFEDTDQHALYNGQPAARIEVYRVGRQTPIQIASTVKKFIAQNRHLLPPGIEMAVLKDRSEIYSQRAKLLLKNGFMGLVLVFFLLGLFLQIRLAFWVMMGIPISFLGAFVFLPALGISINMVSMFAFIIALGIVVDDAIVVGENIYEYHQRGMSFTKAAIRGTRDVITPVSFSILTNVVTFIPLMFIPGVMGKIWKTVPIVVITTFLISWFESMFILPNHLSHEKKKKSGSLGTRLHELQQRFSHAFRNAVIHYYRPFLSFILKWRYVTIAVGVALLFSILGLVASGRMGFHIFPRVESDYAYVTFALPYGAPAEQTEKIGERLLESAERVAEKYGKEQLVEGMILEIGRSDSGSGSHTAEVMVFLTEPKKRPISTMKFVREWRKETGAIGGLEYITFMGDRGRARLGQGIDG